MKQPRARPEPNMRLTLSRVRGRRLTRVSEKQEPITMLPMNDGLEGDVVGEAEAVHDAGHQVAKHEGHIEREEEDG